MSTTILDLPEVRERVSRFSVEEYHGFPEYNANGRRTELIRGIVIEKMPKSPLHSSVSTLLHSLIRDALPAGWMVRADQPLTFPDSEPEPDIAVMRGTTRDFWKEHPRTADLVIEIAISTIALDRANAALYAENGVQEYWIVLVAQSAIEVYRDPQDGVYREKFLVGRDEVLTCGSVPGITLKLADRFR